MSQQDNKKYCPLLKREIYWGLCYEVQDVREDNMDFELLGEDIDLKEAETVCEKCRWYHVTND